VKRLLPLAVLLAGCAAGTPKPARLGGQIVELRESFTCPNAPSRGLITITPDGKVERVVFLSLDVKFGETKTVRETMTLTPPEAANLFSFVAQSGWQDLPENPPVVAPTDASNPNACFGSIMVKTTEGARSVHYAASKRQPKVDALIKGVEAFLSRGTWDRQEVPWAPGPRQVGN
jgi:hypothetical protein